MASSSCNRCGQPSGPAHYCAGDAEALLGRTLDGRYHLQGILGQGGMGTVYRAVQTSVQREVAIKTLHPQLAVAPAFFERFRREAETVSRLKHPHIVTLFDFGRAEDGTCYLVMELLPGESLKEKVKREGPLSLRMAVKIIEQAAKGLAHAHDQQCIHRDLKPHNLMLVRLDGEDFVKVLDFGLVKAAEQDADERLTSTGQVLGTPQYMPPEQAGGENVDERSDLYSLGGVLHYCLTASSPYGANTIRKALTAALTLPLPRVASKRIGAPVPESIEAFLQRCISPEQDDRPASVDEFVAELRAALEGVSDDVLDALPEGAVARTAPASEVQRTISARAVRSRPGAQASGASRPAPSGVSETHAAKDREAPRSSPNTLPYGRPTQPEIPSLKHLVAEAAPRPKPKRVRRLSFIAAPILILGAAAVIGLKVLPEQSGPTHDATTQPVKADPEVKPTAIAPVPTLTADPVGDVKPPSTDSSTRVKVRLTSIPPSVDVFANGVQIGQTPTEITLPRDAVHVLTFRRAGHQSAEKSLDLRYVTADATSLEIRLEAARDGARDTGKPRPKDPEIPVFE